MPRGPFSHSGGPPWARGWHRQGVRPPWWPAGEPWPPADPPGTGAWRGPLARHFFWRIAAVFLLIFVLTTGGCTVAFWLAAAALGAADLPGGVAVAAWAASLAALVVGVGGLAAALRLLRRVTAPIGEFIDAIGRVAAGDFAVRVGEIGPRPVRPLARAFNAMVGRLQANDAQRRGLLADVTHELRTPLTVIQGSLEGMIDGVYPADAEHLAPVLEETRVLARLVEDLRTLALAESGSLALRREPTDLGVVAAEAAAAYRAKAEAAGVRLQVEVADEVPLLDLDPLRIREVLGNLAANALRYTPAGGQVRILGRSGPHGGATLVVEDTGAGIAPEALPHIFERFYKSADSRGSGLGLAIAHDLVAAHGGSLNAESRPGQGTTMTIVLPGR